MFPDDATVVVLGAGSMGHGIAEIAAMAGYTVVLRDIEEDLVEDGYEQIEWSLGKLDEKGQLDQPVEDILSRISTTTDLEAAVSGADLVIEAATERMDLKQEIFAEVDAHAPPGAILASNTSSLSITEIGDATDHPDRVIGLHFFNPPIRMDLVEIVHGEQTSEETVDSAEAFVDSLEKNPIHVRKDVHGFVVNSVLVVFMEEAAWMVSEGTATVQEVDAAMAYRRGYPMGPFELNDFGGIDIAHDFLDGSDRPVPPAIEEMVEAGDLGRKTGRGFYEYEEGAGVDYDPGAGEDVDTLRIEARMINEAAKLIGNDVATAEAIDTGLRLGARLPEGTCRRADKLGLDVALDKLESLYATTGNERFEPAPYLIDLVENGHTGEAAGRGFYDYETDPPYHCISWGLDDDGVLEITLDRPERMNAFSDDMFAEIDRLLSAVDVEDVACVVFRGAGDRAFSAGADITGLTAVPPEGLMDVDETFERIYSYDRPTIAAVEGFCLGAGFELLLCCDLRIATESSTLGAPEIDLGLIPGGGSTQRLPRLVGSARAKELIFRGNHIDGTRAEDWGIVNRAVTNDEFDDVVEEFVEDIVSGPPIALRVAKQTINEGMDSSLETGLSYESRGFAVLATTDDMWEGVAAFRENRDPEFEGQ